MEALAPSLRELRANSLEQIENYLRSLSSPPSEEEFISKIQGILGDAFQNINTKAVGEQTAAIYSFYKITDKLTSGAEITFGGADVRAVDFLTKLDSLYISKYIQNPDAVNVVTEFLKEQYLEGGAGLFGRTAPETLQGFRDLFSQKLSDLEDWQLRRITDTAVQRVRNWAHVSQLNDAGAVNLKIIEMPGCCDFCDTMNGKTISVPNAYQKMSEQMDMTPEEYIEDLKANPPTLDRIQSSIDQGMLPPWHPHCRGRVIIA